MAETMDGPLTGPGGKPEWAMSRRERERAILRAHGLPPRRRWPWVAALLVVLAALAIAGWAWRTGRIDGLLGRSGDAAGEARAAEAGGDSAASDDEGPEALPPLQVNTDEYAVMEPVTLRRTVKVIGPLAPARRADLSAEVSGEVTEVLVRPGDAVAQGDALVRIDVERLGLDLSLARANLESTQSQLALAQGQLDRARSLVERGVAAETTLDDPEANVASLGSTLAAQEDQVAAAELALTGAEVRAPFDGIVQTRTVDPGSLVASGTPILSLVDLSEVEMLAASPVAAGARIQSGQAVEVAVDGIDGRSFAGEVSRIAPVAEEGTRVLTIYVRLDNPDGTLRGGMFATGQIVTDESPDAIAVPATALREDDEGAFVLTIEDGVLARRAVVAGDAWEGDLVAVTDGLAAGDTVVIAAFEADPGRAVELVEY